MSSLVMLLLGLLYLHTTSGQDVRVCEVGSKLEGVPFNICVTISPVPTEDITVNLRSNSSALEALDMNITFTPGGPTEIRVLTMAIINRVYDGLSIITGAYILSGVIQGGVIVIAEPAIPVTLQQPSYSFLEGTLNMVCADIEDSWRLDTAPPDLIYSVEAGSAGGGDYIVVGNTISFQRGNISGCTMISIIQDALEEMPETFNITLQGPASVFAIGSITTAVITIIDDEVNCGNPPQGEGLGVIVGGPALQDSSGNYIANTGATAQYSCQLNVSAETVGNSVLTCSMNGTDFIWAPSELPTCRVLQCAVLQNPADGSVQVSGNTVGSQAIYTCNPGFILSQDVTRTCLETEVWSGVNPECGVVITPFPPGSFAPQSEINRLAIGVGVGVGGAILLLIIVLLCIVICVCCIKKRREKLTSKYVLNYDTVYTGSAARGEVGSRPGNPQSELPQHM